MIILLYGSDSYRRLEKLNEIIEAYRSRHSGLSYERIDLGDDDALQRIKEFLASRSIFDNTRLAVLDGLISGFGAELKEILKKYIDDKDTTIVINIPKKPPVAYKFLLDCQTQEFPQLSGEKLKLFIRKIALINGVGMDNKTLVAIMEMFGGDTWGIATEIEKLSLSGGGGSYSKPSTDYFPLINTIKRGRSIKDRLIALELILSDRGDDPVRVFNSIAYHSLGKREADRLADYDVSVKSGKMEYEEALLDLTING